jgi:hypothetical protein
VIAVAAIVLMALGGQETVSASEYRDRLSAIRSAIDAQDLDLARERATELQSVRVRHEGMVFAPDPTVLRPLARARDLAAAREALKPLSALREALESVPPGRSVTPDAPLLERLRQEEAERALSPEGKVGGPVLHQPSVPRSLREWLRDLFMRLLDFLQKLVSDFLRWLLSLLFGGMGSPGMGEGMTYLVMGLIVLILGTIGVVAYVTLHRRRRTGVEAVATEAPAMVRDEDPLSRTSNEWERFAAELMGSGRFREAIRAWYHAVLVTLFRAGLLHYRKDRTNWEYAYALGPDLPWRPGFVDATRTFEQIWYGRREAPSDAAEAFASDARGILEKVRGGKPS